MRCRDTGEHRREASATPAEDVGGGAKVSVWTGISPCRFESDTLYDDRLIIGEKDKMNDEKITLHIVDGVWGYLSPVRDL